MQSRITFRSFLLIASLISAQSAIVAQSSGPLAAASPTDVKLLAFDVVSIKPASARDTLSTQMINGEAIISSQSMIKFTSDSLTAKNTNAKRLISTAYGIKDDLISGGPGWVRTTGYDIQAKVTSFDPPDSRQLTRSQRNQMLQSLLADRFKLVVHFETKDEPIYELTLAKSGSRLHEATPGDTYPNGPKGPDGVSRAGVIMPESPGKYTAQAVSMSNLSDLLMAVLHRPVVDKTGLTGKYDFTLQYTPDIGPGADAADTFGPTIFTALEEQLGLKLESTKGPVESLVIDRIDPPSAN